MSWYWILIIVVVVLVIVFLICRGLMCWYWKINERLELLSTINSKLNSNLFSNDSDKQKDIIRLLTSIDSKLSEITIKENSNKQYESKSKAEKQDSTNSAGKNSTGDDEYFIIHQNGRTFARKGLNLYCPNCHSFIDSESYTMCSNCGKSLTE